MDKNREYYQKRLEEGFEKIINEIQTPEEVIFGLQYLREFERRDYELGRYSIVLEMLKLEAHNFKKVKSKLIKEYLHKN